MSRRDTIIISVLINAGLLSILFATAWTNDTEDYAVKKEVLSESAELKKDLSKDLVEAVVQKEVVVQAPPLPDPEEINTVSITEKDFVEITVKRGDYLGKIAAANGTSVEEIVRANALLSTQLKIGQKLRVPVGEITVEKEGKSGSQAVAIEEEKYHIVERGDSPWSIANRYKVELADLLRLNDLNEDSARNLRKGQKIRIRA